MTHNLTLFLNICRIFITRDSLMGITCQCLKLVVTVGLDCPWAGPEDLGPGADPDWP